MKTFYLFALLALFIAATIWIDNHLDWDIEPILNKTLPTHTTP